MTRSHLVRLVLALALAVIARVTLAQPALEIIPLRHRTADQVLPVLQPLLEPGASLSGSRGQLFLRAGPANAEEIKRALQAIDRPSKRLQISVRFDDAQSAERRALGASGVIGSAGARIDITAGETRRESAERVDQRLQVLEGSRALIYAGHSRPLPTQSGAVFQEADTGFEVVPRLSGQQLLLEVAPQREVSGPQGSVQGQRIATTVAARLGEWVEIGGTAAQAARDDRGLSAASRARSAESRRVWIKVEELP